MRLPINLVSVVFLTIATVYSLIIGMSTEISIRGVAVPFTARVIVSMLVVFGTWTVVFKSFESWEQKYYNSEVSRETVYELNTTTGEWELVASTKPELNNRYSVKFWNDVEYNLEEGKAPVIDRVVYGSKHFYNKRLVKRSAKE